MKIQRKPDARAVTPMTATQLQRAIARSGLAIAEVAVKIDKSPRRLEEMLKGAPIPYHVQYMVLHL